MISEDSLNKIANDIVDSVILDCSQCGKQSSRAQKHIFKKLVKVLVARAFEGDGNKGSRNEAVEEKQIVMEIANVPDGRQESKQDVLRTEGTQGSQQNAETNKRGQD